MIWVFAAHACGNIVFSIVYDIMSRKSRSAATQEVAAFLMEHTSGTLHGSQLSSLDLKNFVSDTKAPHTAFPEMQKLKAAEIRALVPAVKLLADKYGNGSVSWKHKQQMMEALDLMYQTIYAAGLFLSSDEWRTLDTSATRFLLEYSFLSNEAVAAGKLRFSVVPKFHYLCHIVQQSKYLNPKFTWCYGGEDLVGAASALAHSCTTGTAGWSIQAKMLLKYKVAKHMEWCLQ